MKKAIENMLQQKGSKGSKGFRPGLSLACNERLD
jgi:hypothetical protein